MSDGNLFSEEKKRVTVFVDGFNLYHGIERARLKKFRWLDLKSLAEKFIDHETEEIIEVKYFTAYVNWDNDKKARHQSYVSALWNHSKVKTVFGNFKMRDKECRLSERCVLKLTTPEEKQTDVNIAIHLISSCVKNECDSLLLITGDNDILPSLTVAKELCPDKEMKIILPPESKAQTLRRWAFERKIAIKVIQQDHLANSQLPPTIRRQDGKGDINIPAHWLVKRT